jgi:hypothetical protein
MIDRDNCTPAGLAAQAVKKILHKGSAPGHAAGVKKIQINQVFLRVLPSIKHKTLTGVLDPVKAVQT